MSDINLATATKQELKAYAINNLDLSLSMSMNEDTMIQRIKDKCDKLQIEYPVAKVAVKGSAAKGKKAKYITINIGKQATPGGSDPVFVGVQGVGYTIPRGIDVDVPATVVEALKNAMQDIVTQDEETAELLHEDVLSYPFQIVNKAA